MSKNSERNRTMLQAFEWYLPEYAKHWKRLAANADRFRQMGIDMVWLPPAYKAWRYTKDENLVGYAVYDRYDLGQYPQQERTETKYGSISEYMDLIRALQDKKIAVLADMVMNHMMGGEAPETFGVTRYENDNRNPGAQKEHIEDFTGYTIFNYPGRGGEQNGDTWNKDYFNALESNGSIYLIDGRQFNTDVDWENGNYDCLMGMNLDYSNPLTRERMINWGRWYLNTTHVDGFRLDAIKHISNSFMKEWADAMRQVDGYEDMFIVGEYWGKDYGRQLNYLDQIDDSICLFDVDLHNQLHDASASDGNYDMRQLFNDSLLEARPGNAVTFVDNHDTQPGQQLPSRVLSWFKQQAYALILFQKEGTPCVFYGDLYGLDRERTCADTHANGDVMSIEKKEFDPVADLPKMLMIRKTCAHGSEKKYYGKPHAENEAMERRAIGYTRAGCPSRYPYGGMAVLVTCAEGASMNMYVNAKFKGEWFVDALHPDHPWIQLDEHGFGDFEVWDGQAAVYIREKAYRYFTGDFNDGSKNRPPLKGYQTYAESIY